MIESLTSCSEIPSMISETSCSLRAADEASPPPLCPTRLQKQKYRRLLTNSITHITVIESLQLHNGKKRQSISTWTRSVRNKTLRVFQKLTASYAAKLSQICCERERTKSCDLTSACAPAALFVCGSLGTVSRSTPAPCSPWLGAAGCFRCAPPSSPRLPSAGHSAGKISVPEATQQEEKLSLLLLISTQRSTLSLYAFSLISRN